MGLPKFSRKIDNDKMEIKRENLEILTRETLERRIANLQLRLDKLRIVLAEYDAA